jgi:hypothetical protein
MRSSGKMSTVPKSNRNKNFGTCLRCLIRQAFGKVEKHRRRGSPSTSGSPLVFAIAGTGGLAPYT